MAVKDVLMVHDDEPEDSISSAADWKAILFCGVVFGVLLYLNWVGA